MSGYFITFEGPDGSGKTTIINMLLNSLQNDGFDAMSTREPGGSSIAEQIREVILHPKNTEMDSRTEALLYAAARRQHLVEIVEPALKENKILLCDRFLDSSLAYQGYARGIGVNEVLAINEFAINGMMPSLTIYFDLDPKIGLERISLNQTREINRLDMEKLDFHMKVREGYRKLAKEFKDRIYVINAEQSIEDVFLEVKQFVYARISN